MRAPWPNIVGAIFIFLSIVAALVSNYLNGKVMGEAGLGYGVFAPPRGSPEWEQKASLRRWADRSFYTGMLFAFLGVGAQLWNELARWNQQGG